LSRKIENNTNFNPFEGGEPPNYQGNLPPGDHPPPHGPRTPFGSLPFFGPPHHFKPPLPMTRESFKEIRYFMILMILSDNPEGITGYQFQEKYKLPRGNLLRIMNELEKLEYVITSESVIKGRAQKFFIITDKGKDYLDDLKKKWADRFAQMSEFAAPDMLGRLFMRRGFQMFLSNQLDHISSKEDAIDLFRGLRSKVKTFKARITDGLKELENAKSGLDSIIQRIEEMEILNLDEIKNLVNEKLKLFVENNKDE